MTRHTSLGLGTLAILLLFGCSGEPAADRGGPPALHLFSDMQSWRVLEPRAPVLPPDVHARLVEILQPGKAMRKPEDAIWIMGEKIDELRWEPREEFGLQRKDAELWSCRMEHPLAFPIAELTHPDLDLQPRVVRTANAPVHSYNTEVRSVLLVLPKGALRTGFEVTYPTLPNELFGHLSDFTREPTAVPSVRQQTVGRETRRCIFLPPSMAIRSAFQVPPGGRLHFGVSVDAVGLRLVNGVLVPGDSSSDGVGFRLTIATPDGAAKVVWGEFLTPELSGRFHDAVVALDEWAGQRVELTFSTYGTPPGGEAASDPLSHVLHDFAFLSEPLLTRGGEGSASAPNVLLVLVDTLRADALGCYGGEPAQTPVLDQLAREGVLFEQARASSSWTLPSHVSLFCSAFPTQHGTLRMSQTLPSGFSTVAEMVRDGGWRTMAITGGVILSPAYGFARGFDRFEASGGGVRGNANKLLDWIDAEDVPFFAFLHTYAVHDPYDPNDEYRSRYVPEYSGTFPAVVDKVALERHRAELGGELPSREDIEYVRALYQGEVAQADAELGAFFAELRSRGLWDNTLIVVTSDHGEEFWDHGDYRHGRTLYEELLHVPLIVRHPARFRGGQRVAALVRLEDVAPTICQFLGIPSPPEWIGIPLSDPKAPRDVLAAITPWDNVRATHQSIQAMVRDRHKWIQTSPGAYRSTPAVGSQLFDLATDPGELDALDDENVRAEYRSALEGLLAKYPPRFARSKQVVLPMETLEQLRALGYVK